MIKVINSIFELLEEGDMFQWCDFRKFVWPVYGNTLFLVFSQQHPTIPLCPIDIRPLTLILCPFTWDYYIALLYTRRYKSINMC